MKDLFKRLQDGHEPTQTKCVLWGLAIFATVIIVLAVTGVYHVDKY